MKKVILIGFMGAGKTTIGRLLAEETKQSHVDFDDLIVAEIGMTIQEFFDQHGEEAFRKIETDILAKTLAKEQIISTGGGIVLKEENALSRVFKNRSRGTDPPFKGGYW